MMKRFPAWSQKQQEYPQKNNSKITCTFFSDASCIWGWSKGFHWRMWWRWPKSNNNNDHMYGPQFPPVSQFSLRPSLALFSVFLLGLMNLPARKRRGKMELPSVRQLPLPCFDCFYRWFWWCGWEWVWWGGRHGWFCAGETHSVVISLIENVIAVIDIFTDLDNGCDFQWDYDYRSWSRKSKDMYDLNVYIALNFLFSWIKLVVFSVV